MSAKHQDKRWQSLRAQVKPRLLAALPAPCPRCGRMMERGQALDLGHVRRGAAVDFDPANVRLEHRRCNRQDGQRITTGKRVKKKELPKW